MPRFIVTGVDPQLGQRVTKLVDAANEDEARKNSGVNVESIGLMESGSTTTTKANHDSRVRICGYLIDDLTDMISDLVAWIIMVLFTKRGEPRQQVSKKRSEYLDVVIWTAIAFLLTAILPVWPIGCYSFVRLVVTSAAIFMIYTLGTRDTKQTVGLVLVALLFNPVIEQHLGSKLIWSSINLSVAIWFWVIFKRQLTITPPKQEEDVI